jgi:hypothetical protein
MEGFTVLGRAVLTAVHVTSPKRDHVRDLRGSIEGVSRLRYSLAHECSHLMLADSHNERNCTGLTPVIASLRLATGLVTTAERLAVSPADARSASATPASRLKATELRSERDSTTALAWTMPLTHRQHTVPRLSWVCVQQTFQRDVPSANSRVGLLRVIDGILAALHRQLAVVLTALARHLDTLSFVLVMLATCLRYGRRAEPGDHAFLPMRRNLTSMGSCPLA